MFALFLGKANQLTEKRKTMEK